MLPKASVRWEPEHSPQARPAGWPRPGTETDPKPNDGRPTGHTASPPSGLPRPLHSYPQQSSPPDKVHPPASLQADSAPSKTL